MLWKDPMTKIDVTLFFINRIFSNLTTKINKVQKESMFV